jgi:hypothetical protein
LTDCSKASSRVTAVDLKNASESTNASSMAAMARMS